METKKVYSYGIIPIHKTTAGLEILVIHMYGSAGGTHWTFPKGRPEAGETPLQSATRECYEEVGITPDTIFGEQPLSESYTFTYEGVSIEKTVTFFIGLVTDTAIVIQPSEIKEACWLPIAEVRARLTHQNTKEFFDTVQQRIDILGLT